MFGSRMILVSSLLAITSPVHGLGRLELNTEDAVVIAGRPVYLITALQRKYTLAASDDIENATVDFYLGGKPVGQAVSDRNGTATLACEVPAGIGRPQTYSVRAYYKDRTIEGTGRVYYWDAKRTAIAVDIDETISHTHYSDLFIADVDKYSRPLAGSIPALWKLSKQYDLLYISARPRFLNQKTRDWLSLTGFPDGPVANALKFEACLHQRRYKEEMLVRLRERLPTLLIGVGDKGVDDRAYGANRMLTIIVDRHESHVYRDHCLVFADWDGIAEFFDTQQSRLVDAAGLSRLIADSDMNLRPIFASPPIIGEPTDRMPSLEAAPLKGVAKAGTTDQPLKE